MPLRPLPSVIRFNPSQQVKALPPMDRTLSGIVILRSALEQKKLSSPTASSVSGRETLVIESQALSACDPNVVTPEETTAFTTLVLIPELPSALSHQGFLWRS